MQQISKAKTIKIFLFAFLLFAAGIINAQVGTGRNYYVKGGGDDNKDGLSDENAWKTLTAVNNHMSSFKPGDAILFQRGSYFANFLYMNCSGTAANPIIFGAYGTGPKPVFIGATQVWPVDPNLGSHWTQNKANNKIWEYYDAVLNHDHVSNQATPDYKTDVSNLILREKGSSKDSFGIKLMDKDSSKLDSQGKFWYSYSTGKILLYSDSDPTEFYDTIQYYRRFNALNFNNNNNSFLIFENLDFRYYNFVVQGGASNCSFINLDISFIGGSNQNSDYEYHNGEIARQGNGLQMWRGDHDITVTGCRIDNCYDAGISPQGDAVYPGGCGYNIFIRNNVISNCEYSFEYFYKDTNYTAHDIFFENNTCVNAGGGWSHSQRPHIKYTQPNGVNGTQIRIGKSPAPQYNIFIRNNIFYKSTERLFALRDTTSNFFKNWVLDYNDYYQSPGGIIGQNPKSVNYYSWSELKNFIGQEGNSYNLDPMFVSPTDFHLQPGSPLIGRGIDVGYGKDIGAFPYGPDKWVRVADYGGGARVGAAGFSIGNKGYVGTGLADGYKNDFWEYDPGTNIWTQKEDFGGEGRQGAAGFSIGDRGYIGTGFSNSGYKIDFWEYDPTTNQWKQIADLIRGGRDNAVAFSIGNKGYVGTGNGKSDFLEYDPSSNTWTKKANFGGGSRAEAAGFSIGNKGYIGTGMDGVTHYYKNDFWEYDPSTNVWTQKADFGGIARRFARGFSIDNKGYIGIGADSTGTNKNDFWEYDPSANLWTQRTNFGGAARIRATSFSIGNAGYIGMGPYAGDFWEYTPGAPNTWAKVADYGGGPRVGAAGFSIGNKGYVGTGLADGYKRDFWEYNPADNIWTQKEDFGGEGRQGAAGFSIGDRGYIGTGFSNSGYKIDFWEYNPTTNQWKQIADLIRGGRDNAVAFSIGNKGYVGTGNGKSDFLEYDPSFNTWTKKANFGGGSRAEAAGFSIGNKGYIGTGMDGITHYYKNDFWEYDPCDNVWTQKADFGGIARRYARGFSIGSKGYIGTGVDSTGANKNDLWEYDPSANFWTQQTNFGGEGRIRATSFSIGNAGYIGMGPYAGDFWEYTPGTPNTWLKVADYGGETIAAAGFSIGNKGYVGTGVTNVYERNFWEFDPATNVWTQKEDFGGEARQGAASFSIGDRGYMGTGYSNSGYKTDFWEYDPTTNQWKQIADLIRGGRDNAVAFSIGNKGYVGTGNGKSDFLEYDPSSNTWTKKGDYGGGSRAGAAGFSIGNKGYIGTGMDGITHEYKNDFWEYDPSTNVWTQKANFGGVGRRFARGFSIGSMGYIGTGVDNTGTNKNDLWEYDPYANTWTQRANFGGQGRKMATSFTIGNAGYIGTGSVGTTSAGTGLSSRDFWKYTPLPGNTIATHVASTELHPGSPVEVKFEPYGIYSEMSFFTAHLSDSTGDFTKGVIIGTVEGTVSCNIINALVPPNTPPGNRYRIRVISDNPDATGSDNGKDLTILNVLSGNIIAKGIYNPNLLDCKVTPNPSSQYFDVHVVSATNERIEVNLYDISGRLLSKMGAVRDQTLRFGDNLRPGVYMVQVTQGQQKKMIKVIKQ